MEKFARQQQGIYKDQITKMTKQLKKFESFSFTALSR